jgi:enediyne biosynthesis protein E4
MTCAAASLLLFSCQQNSQLFSLRTGEQTGLTFANTITESDSFNVLDYEYIYNGAGVGVADFNQDGLTDIFFAGNMVTSELYLNNGDLTFRNVTEAARVTTQYWCTGVSIVDVNNDGWPDMYISTAHPRQDESSPNIFFLNKGVNAEGIPVFEDIAQQAGVADRSYATQAVFFDYDLDEDLDLYLLTNAMESYSRNTPIGQKNDGTGRSVDKLYRNDSKGDDQIHFTDVSAEAGILTEGWGLGIVANDFNDDGLPDIYCANDFLSNDHLYINQGNGTFKNEIASRLKHQEFNGMGIDIADINNDGLNDIIALDMMPEDNLRQKTMFSGIGYDRFYKSLQMNYQPQYIRNVLQLNNGNGTFSDIGYLAGVYATDWSWSALLADFDNDGFRDLMITNGYKKDVTDLDFVAYSKELSMFGTHEAKVEKARDAIKNLGGVHKPNVIFKNNGDLTFSNKTDQWGFSHPAYSNGSAHADFDNDGDLDLVTNNINEPAFIYENKLNEFRDTNQQHYLMLKFKKGKNSQAGIGAKVWIYSAGKTWFAEHQLQRGYKSSVEPVEHIGLGNVDVIDSLVIRWPGNKYQKINNIKTDTTITLLIDDAQANVRQQKTFTTLLVKSNASFDYRHTEKDFVDFKQGQATLPHKHSQSGPTVTSGDVNSDGLDDFVVGGSAGEPTLLFMQNQAGGFRKIVVAEKKEEDTGVLLFDADGDGDLDLYCVSGSSEFLLKKEFFRDRLYTNKGEEKFEISTDALPATESSGGVVVSCDYDHDGDLDIFRGGRVVPTRYPEAPVSYLLQNDGKGKFKEVTHQVAPTLQKIGMVTDAVCTDINSDGWEDLVVVGEWMPFTILLNNRGIEFTKAYEEHTGWWNSVAAGDFDQDGDQDLVAGNLGRNSIFQASQEQPVSIYAKDFDQNGSIDPFITRYNNGKEYPVHYRETMTDQIAGLKRILKQYKTYGAMTFHELFSDEQLRDALVYRSTFFQSAYIENLGNLKFEFRPLPVNAQTSPINDISVADINNDGKLDFLAVQNSYACEPLAGYYDAGIGLCAIGNGNGTFQFLKPNESGFVVDKDARSIASISVQGKLSWIATCNQDSILLFSKNNDQHEIAVK